MCSANRVIAYDGNVRHEMWFVTIDGGRLLKLAVSLLKSLVSLLSAHYCETFLKSSPGGSWKLFKAGSPC